MDLKQSSFLAKARSKLNKASFILRGRKVNSKCHDESISFWPNIQIINNCINLTKVLPEDHQGIKPLILRESEKEYFANSQVRKSLTKMLRAVGQVIVLYVDKKNIFNYGDPMAATFSVVQTSIARQYEGWTVAHVFNDLSSQLYYKIIFVSFEEQDLYEEFDKLISNFYEKERDKIKLIEPDILKDNNIDLLSDLLFNCIHDKNSILCQKAIFQAKVNEQFLVYRKLFLKNVGENAHLLLDPITGLQCLPSVDLTVIEFSQQCQDYIKKQKIVPFKLVIRKDFKNTVISQLQDMQEQNTQTSSDMIVNKKRNQKKTSKKSKMKQDTINLLNQIQIEEANADTNSFENIYNNDNIAYQCEYVNQVDENLSCALVGYHYVKGQAFREDDTEYSECKGLLPIHLSLLVHRNKSLSLGKILKTNGCIIDFEATTSYGTSGAPLIDQQGNLLGINTGSFDDNTDYEDVKTSADIIRFDINVPEKEENYNSRKNFNCAININHPITIAWILQDKNILKKNRLVKQQCKSKNKQQSI